MIELVLGGARSGKSGYAERQATQSGLDVIYIATAEARDSEMQTRIDRHRRDRPPHWLTVEQPIELAAVMAAHDAPGRLLLVDCLTLWLSNILFDSQGRLQRPVWQQQTDALFSTLPHCGGSVLMVSNEIGMGVVATDPMTRLFVDEAGFLHQRLARLCDKVTWVVAGLPQTLKP